MLDDLFESKVDLHPLAIVSKRLGEVGIALLNDFEHKRVEDLVACVEGSVQNLAVLNLQSRRLLKHLVELASK